jgi:diguanylate cyclase (GGDEF)-like protein
MDFPVTARGAEVLLLIGPEGGLAWPDQKAGGPDERFQLHRSDSLADAVAFLRDHAAGAAVCDLDLPDSRGTGAIARLLEIAPTLAVVALSARDHEALALEATRRGAEDFLVKARTDPDMLARRVRLALERKRQELAVAYHVLQVALHDDLTGVATRTLLAEAWPQIVARSQRRHVGIAVLMLDIDDFKLINDTHGHVAGDQVLVTVARRLAQCIRRTDHLVRYGGDEFVIVAEEIATQDDLKRIMGAIRDQLDAPVPAGRLTVRISASIGEVLAIPTHSDTWNLEALIRRADAAMYARKRARKKGRPPL